MGFRILGPLEMHGVAGPVTLAPGERTILAALLLADGHLVSVDRLMQCLWEGEPPPTALNSLQAHISRIRKRLREAFPAPGSPAIHKRGNGYQLDRGRIEVDLVLFDESLRAARQARDTASYEQALALWRGAPLADTPSAHLVLAHIPALEERRLAVLEEYHELRLGAGEHHALVSELEALAGQWPLRARFVQQLATALHRCGRTVEALETIRAAKRRLAEDYGLEPGAELDALERDLLRGAVDLVPERTRHTAPPGPTHFVGRDADLAWTVNQLRIGTGTRVGIHGSPGVGKTALALSVAAVLRDLGMRDQLFVDLGGTAGPVSDRDLLGLLLHGMGVQAPAVPDQTQERAVLLRSLVSAAPPLLVLDNVAEERQVRQALAAQWSGVLLTSRARLTALEDTEHRRLEVLDPEASSELLRRLAGHQAGTDAEGTARIVALCGGLALALRLAGVKLAARPHWTPGRMAERLADERHRLDELQAGDQAVRASLEVSYAALDPPAQRAFRVAGRLGPITVVPWLLAAALDIAEAEATDQLENLVAAELLRAVPAHEIGYRFHDLIQVYASERFAEAEPVEVAPIARRICAAFLAVALRVEQVLSLQGVHPCGRESTPDFGLGHLACPRRVPIGAEPLPWLERHRHQAVSAVRLAHETGQWPHCWALARALTPLLEAGCHFDEWLEVCRMGLDAAERAGEPGWAAAINASLGTLYHYRTQWTESLAALESALKVWQRPEDRVRAAYAKLVYCMTLRLAEPVDTTQPLTEALEIGLSESDIVLQIEARRCLAWVERDRGRSAAAVEQLSRAMHSAAAVGDRLRGYILHDLGVMHTDQGHFDRAAESLRQAWEIFAAHDDRHWMGLSSRRLGEVLHSTGDTEQAIAWLVRAREIFASQHDRLWEASCLARLGNVHRERGEYTEAERHLNAAAAVYEHRGEWVDHAFVQVGLGELWEAQGRHRAALAAFEAALGRLSSKRSHRWRERAEAGLARVRLCLGAGTEAGAVETDVSEQGA